MDPLIGGSLISAASNFLGGIFGSKDDKKARRQAEEQQAQMIALQQAQAQKNYEQQKEFAQHGIRWKVDDAKAAGIHPLYALGASPISYSPSYVDGGSISSSGGSGGIGAALAEAGAGIGRAVAAGKTADERAMDALNLRLAAANVRGAELQNEILASDGALKRAQLGAAVPSMFDGDTGNVAASALPGTGGASPFWKLAYNRDGRAYRVYNDELGDNEFLMAGSLPVTVMDLGASYGKSYAHKIKSGIRNWWQKTKSSYSNAHNAFRR